MLGTTTPAVPIQRGKKRPVRRLRKELKKHLVTLKKAQDGYFLKSTRKPPDMYLFDLTDVDDDESVCYEAKWCKDSPGLPKNCGSWTNSCPCKCAGIERDTSKHDQGLDVAPEGSEWFNAMEKKKEKARKVKMVRGQPNYDHDWANDQAVSASAEGEGEDGFDL